MDKIKSHQPINYFVKSFSSYYDYDYDTGKTTLRTRREDPQNKKEVNYNKSKPRIQLSNCSIVSMSIM